MQQPDGDQASFARRHIAGRDLSGAFPQALWRAMGTAGLFRVGLPASHGGDGGSLSHIAATERMLAEIGGSPGLASAWTAHQMVARHFIAGFASPAQQAAWLPRLATGASTAAIAISEPEVGAHPKLLTTAATRTAGGWRLHGRKAFLTNGPIADLFIVLAITDETAGRKSYSCFLVPEHTPGLSRLPGRDIPALHPAGHCGLALDNCDLPADALLGPQGDAYPRMALPFRDVEDAVSTSGLAGTLAHVLATLATALPTDAPPEQAAALGHLLGLSALIDHAAAALPATDPQATQALMIGIRQLAALLLPRLREATSPSNAAYIEARLAAVEIGLSVARGPRAARAGRLARAAAARGCPAPASE